MNWAVHNYTFLTRQWNKQKKWTETKNTYSRYQAINITHASEPISIKTWQTIVKGRFMLAWYLIKLRLLNGYERRDLERLDWQWECMELIGNEYSSWAQWKRKKEKKLHPEREVVSVFIFFQAKRLEGCVVRNQDLQEEVPKMHSRGAPIAFSQARCGFLYKEMLQHRIQERDKCTPKGSSRLLTESA